MSRRLPFRLLSLSILASAAAASLVGCSDDESMSEDGIELSVAGFPANSPTEGHYELWISFALLRDENTPTQRHSTRASAGKFRVDSAGELVALDGSSVSFDLDVTDDDVPLDEDGNPIWQIAVDAFITIESDNETDPDARVPGLIGGSFLNGDAVLGTAYADAIDEDFEGISGSCVLATPTNDITNDESEGIWFTNGNGDAPTLALPSLIGAPAGTDPPTDSFGWTYEAWVTRPEGDTASLGRFTRVDVRDDDGGGPLALTGTGYDYPGSDFPFGATGIDLRGSDVFVTIEPFGDEDGDQPFIAEVLRGRIAENAVVGTPITLTASPLPTAMVSIPFTP